MKKINLSQFISESQKINDFIFIYFIDVDLYQDFDNFLTKCGMPTDKYFNLLLKITNYYYRLANINNLNNLLIDYVKLLYNIRFWNNFLLKINYTTDERQLFNNYIKLINNLNIKINNLLYYLK